MTTTEITLSIALAFGVFYCFAMYFVWKKQKAQLLASLEECMELKQKNYEMCKDIRVLIREEDSTRKTMVSQKWKYIFYSEDMPLFGGSSRIGSGIIGGGGIINQIQENKRQ